MASFIGVINEHSIKHVKPSSSSFSLIEKRIFDDSNAFIDIIVDLKTVFLNNNNMPTMYYTHFMLYILSSLEFYSIRQLKTIERFCLRMDEDALTGIVKYNNNIICTNLSYLFKKYKIDHAVMTEIIKKRHVNLSNSLINILAKNIRVNKPTCNYTNKCYRKNAEHLKSYFH